MARLSAMQIALRHHGDSVLLILHASVDVLALIAWHVWNALLSSNVCPSRNPCFKPMPSDNIPQTELLKIITFWPGLAVPCRIPGHWCMRSHKCKVTITYSNAGDYRSGSLRYAAQILALTTPTGMLLSGALLIARHDFCTLVQQCTAANATWFQLQMWLCQQEA